MRQLIVFLLLSAFAVTAAPAKIYLLHGGPSHGPGEHEFRAGSILLARALNEQSGLPVEAVVQAGWPADDSILDDAAAILIYCDHTSVTKKGFAKLDQLAAKGVGIMLMHYAVHPAPEEGAKYYNGWTGGFMETGWSVNPHWVADLQPKPGHPVGYGITGTVKAFDEFYFNMRFLPIAEGATRHNLITATPTKDRLVKIINLWCKAGEACLDSEQTLMWGIERPDGGRGVGFTGGHYHRNWANDGFRTMVLNALCWAAKVEVPAGGVKSLPISAEDLNKNIDGTPKQPIAALSVEEMTAMKPGPFRHAEK